MSDQSRRGPQDWQPNLVGQLWGNYQGASALSVLIRQSRLNYLAPGDIRQALGITIRRRIDIFGLMTLHDARLAALAASQRFEQDFIDAWNPSWWWPYANAIPQDALGWSLRICPQCMHYAYHSLFFQMPGVTRCPWHGCDLIESCARCGKRLLEGFDEGAQLLQCVCGHDHVDDEAALYGDSTSGPTRADAVARYHSWCTARQRETWLVAPEVFDPHGWQAMAGLVDLPHYKGATSTDVLIDHAGPGLVTDVPANSGFEKMMPTMVSLPLHWLRDVRAICHHLAVMLPPGSLTVAERRALDPGTFYDEDRGCTAVRPWIQGLAGYPVGKVAMLHIGPIDGVASRLIGRLAAGFDASGFYVTEPAPRRAFRRWVRADPSGLPLLEGTMRRVLSRGYADGCRMLLGQVHPDLFSRRSTRPVRRFPWVEMRLGETPQARIAWTRQVNA